MSRVGILTIPVDATGESTRIARFAVFVTVVLVGGVLAWGSLAPMTGAVVATGVIKVDTNRKAVQHLEGGIVRQILVREGDEVKEGQALILLEDTDRSAELNILTDALHGHLVKEARLIAEASLAETVTFPADLEQIASEKIRILMQNELALFTAKRKSLTDQIRLIEDEIVHAEEAVRSLEKRAVAGEEGLAILKEQLTAGEKMMERQALDRNSLLELRRRYASQDELLWETKSDLAIRRQDVASLRLRVVSARNDYQRAAEDELKLARQEAFETEERMRPALDALQRKTIRASIAGQVINLKVTSVGGVVRPGETLAEIVPDQRDLIFEVKIKPSDADAVFVGQDAKIEIAAFNQQATPLLDGTLNYVSGDALVDEQKPNDPSFYLGHVHTNEEAMKALEGKSLAPGMPVVAYLQTQPRTFFQYLFSPITSGFRRALVEDMQ
jgi:epimerase transport system membrane fusion protein